MTVYLRICNFIAGFLIIALYSCLILFIGVLPSVSVVLCYIRRTYL